MGSVAFVVGGCGDNIHLGKPAAIVTPLSGLQTTEAGGQATFTVALDGRPRKDVIIDLSSSNAGEGTITPTLLTFTRENFDAPQVVTITGVQDEVADGATDYTILLAPVMSEDPRFHLLDPDDVAVENIDDDTAGVRVTPVSGLTTTEAGGSAQFTVVLNSRPIAPVTVPLSSSDVGEGTVSPAELTFTMDDWAAPQTVTVTGVDDRLADGAQNYTIVTALPTTVDTGYAVVDGDDVTVSNTDDDTAGIAVTVLDNVTTEAGGQGQFTVVLNSQPTANVTIPIVSLDLSEGLPDVTSLTFTATNWDAPQTVTVTGLDDLVADGNQVYTVITDTATSTDTDYDLMDANDASLTNTDNDSAGITLADTANLTTTESGGQDTFTIVLNSQPTATVTIGLSSSDTTEGTVSPSSLTFTVANWNAPQTVRLTGADDALDDGNQVFSIVTASAVSADGNYNGMDPADAPATNIDNDSAGFIVSPTGGLVTTESGGQATFTVVLTSQPTANVTIPVISGDTSEGTVNTSALTFTPANWDAPQSVTITGADDLIADGSQTYTINLQAAASGDATYLGLDPVDVGVTNTDNDSAGITVSETSITTNEGGGQDTFTIVLNSQPTANVTIGVSSNDTSEGTVNPTSVTFTTTNWNAPQLITVTGVNDFVSDGNQVYQIVTAPATSADAGYQGRNAADVDATNVDNDSPGIIVTPTSGLQTDENGGTATFTIVLASQPTAQVTIGLTSSDIGEGTVSPDSVTFTTVNWNAPQLVTVTGVNDAIADGGQLYTIVTANAVSADGQYNTLAVDDVTVTNLDNDTAGIIVSPTTGLTVSETGTSATFSIVLQSQPSANVTISVTSNDPSEGTASPTTLTFTPVNWDAAQNVAVTGVDDAIADGNQVFTVAVLSSASADPAYNNIDPPDVSVTTIDNDSPGVRVTPTSGISTTEAGGTASFDVVLESQPLANVTISLLSSDTTEGTITQSTLTFTPVNWSSPQTVTVTGVDDAIADGNQPYTIQLGASSADPGYNVIDPPDVALTNIDDDTASVLVTPITGLVTTEAGGADFFTVVLSSQPAADVTFTVTSSNPAEGSLAISSVTFTTTDWDVPHTVSVTGVDDAITDGNQAYTILTGNTTSADPAFNNLVVADVAVTNNDNDIAGFTLDPTGGLLTSEFGDFDTFTIVLNAAPSADVTIGLSSSDLTEATLGGVTGVTFTPLNWNVPQTITVTGVNDNLADGAQPFFVVTAPAVSADPNYNGLNPPDIDGSNFDDDTPGVFVKARRLLRTSESGQSSFFRVRLTTQPTANVTCTFSSSDPTEGSISLTTLTFTPTNYATQQQINVLGVDDAIVDGDQLWLVLSAPCTSADGSYNGQDPRDVQVINRDND